MKKLISIINKKMKDLIDFYVEKIYKHKRLFLLLISLITSFFLFFTSKLELKTNFEALLPEKAESVIVLNEYAEKVGGINRLVVVVETENFEAGKKFVLNFVEEAKKIPENIIKTIDYDVKEIKQYYKDNFLFYLDKDELHDLNNKIKEKIRCEREKRKIFNLNLLEEEKEEEECIDFDIAKLEEEYGSKIKTNKYREGFYTNEEGTLFAITIVPNISSLSFKEAEQFNNDIDAIIKKLNPKTYAEDMSVGTTGNIKSRVEEHKAIKNDIVSTAFLVIFLVSLSIFIFFLNISSIIVLIVNLVFAIIWALGISYFIIGNLNSQTAFLTSIIVGTGVNYGIILLFRLLEELEKDYDIKTAMITSLKNTYIPTLLSALTTSISFMSLTIAKSSGFSEFGWIGTIGIMLCWIFTMTLIPILIFNFDNYKFLKFKKRNNLKINIYISNIVLRLIKNKKLIIPLGVSIFAIGLFSLINYLPNSLEYDFSKLRNKSTKGSGTKELADKVQEVFSQNLTPSVVLTDSKEESKMLCDMIEKENKIYKTYSKFRTFGKCLNILNLLPNDQDKKLPLITDIKNTLNSNAIQWLDDDDYYYIVNLRNEIKTRKLQINDLPKNFRESFKGSNYPIGQIVFIEQNPDYRLVLKDNLLEYANAIRKIELPNGKIVKSSGEWVIFADLLSLVKDDIPVVTVFAFSFVFLALLFLTGSLKASYVIICAVIFSISTMLGIMGIIDMKINFFNFIAIPLTLGVGVDYPLNIYTRFKIDNYKNFNNVITNTGAAVILCSITTIVSYLTLLLATSRALASFGVVALIGEFCSIYSALFIIPIVHNLINKK